MLAAAGQGADPTAHATRPPTHIGKPTLDGPGRDPPVVVHRPVEAAPEQEETVGVGHRLEQPQPAVRLHDLEDRREHRVVPVARALLGRDEPLDRTRVIERVRLDRLLQLEIAVGIRESEPAPGQRHIEPGHPAEAPLLRCRPDRRHRGAGREMEVGLESIDVGLDELPPRRDRHRQALVAVLDEKGVVDLEERDRHVDDAGVRRALSDGLAELRAARPEAPVEVVDAADGSDDVGDRDLPAADRQACHQAEAPADLFEWEEIGSVTPPQRRPHHRSVAVGLAEITPVWRSPLAWRDGLQRSPAVRRAQADRRPRSTLRLSARPIRRLCSASGDDRGLSLPAAQRRRNAARHPPLLRLEPLALTASHGGFARWYAPRARQRLDGASTHHCRMAWRTC